MTTRIIELKMKYGERDYTKLDSLQEKGWQIKDWNTVSTPDMEWQGFNVRHFIMLAHPDPPKETQEDERV